MTRNILKLLIQIAEMVFGLYEHVYRADSIRPIRVELTKTILANMRPVKPRRRRTANRRTRTRKRWRSIKDTVLACPADD